MMLFVAGEDISAGEHVASADGVTVWREATICGRVAPSIVLGTAVEQIREGFRVHVSRSREVREDDA